MPSASRVLDINTLPTGSFPSELTELNGALYFTARGSAGAGLWRTDGTAEGTTLVRSFPEFAVTDMVNANGTLYLQVDHPGFSTGWTLWKSDGTAEGTVPVRVITTVENPVPFRAAAVGDTVFFVQFDGSTFRSTLWKSDGTTEGTVALRDFDGSYQGPEELTAFNGKLYFTAPDASFGPELWTSDGTAEGTVALDVIPGPNGIAVDDITAAGDALYFTAITAATGRELWRSDGTLEGTRVVADLFPGSRPSDPVSLTPVDGGLFFAADDGIFGREVWFTDGTEIGTYLIRDLNRGAAHGVPISGPGHSQIIRAGDAVLFVGNDGTRGAELWRTDGTTPGTVLVKDINPGSAGMLGGVSDATLVEWNGVVYFQATDGVTGRELWRSDGTEKGTFQLRDITPGLAGTRLGRPVAAGGLLYFSAEEPTTNFELWATDGSPKGTGLVIDLSAATVGSVPEQVTQADGRVYFVANDGVRGQELWVSDGTAEGTRLVRDIGPGSRWGLIRDLTFARGTLFFTTDIGSGRELWKTDGTEIGTQRVRPGLTDVASLTEVNNWLFFTAYTEAAGTELWKTDGTSTRTIMVRDIRPGRESGLDPFGGSNLVNFGDTLYFTADDGTHGRELWQSDGTPTGTGLVADINPGRGHAFALAGENFRPAGGLLFFTANDGTNGRALWASDGTAEGTYLVMDVHPGAGAADFSSFSDVNGQLYFVADDGAHGRELWASDGTAEGTRMVADLRPGVASAFTGTGADALTVFQDRLYFVADDGTHGRELWASDGTAEGTALVVDINPGSDGSLPGFLQAAGTALYFAANDGTSGVELWSTDGTAEGTRVSKEIFAGPAGSSPAELTVAGGRLFFAAEDEVGGRELWALELAESGPSSGYAEDDFLRSRVGLIDLPMTGKRGFDFGAGDPEREPDPPTADAGNWTVGWLEPAEVLSVGHRVSDPAPNGTERRGDTWLEGIPFVFTGDVE